MIKRQFGSISLLPNKGSPHQTPASLSYDLHWENLQLIARWDWDRFARLSSFLRHTPYELGSLVMLRHDAVDQFQRFNKITVHNGQSIALTLTLLEAHLLAEWKRDVIKNPFPSIAHGKPEDP